MDNCKRCGRPIQEYNEYYECCQKCVDEKLGPAIEALERATQSMDGNIKEWLANKRREEEAQLAEARRRAGVTVRQSCGHYVTAWERQQGFCQTCLNADPGGRTGWDDGKTPAETCAEGGRIALVGGAVITLVPAAIIWNAAGWTGLLVAAAVLFVIFCMWADSGCEGGSVFAGGGSFAGVVCRIIGSHAKLAFKVAGCVFFYFGALLGATTLLKPQAKSVSSGGPESEELAGFMNTILFFPRMLLEGIVALGKFFMFIGLLLMIWLTEFLLNHLTLFFATLAVLYVYWGICKVHQIVREEYRDPSDREIRRPMAIVAWAPIAACVLYYLVGMAVMGYTSPGIEYAKLW